MPNTAEYGVAAHWKYKDGITRVGGEEKFAWIRSLLEAQQDTEAGEFMHELKIDMFADEVFVFTPKGDVINLPAGATPIDFAYSIHSQVGNHMTSARVNGRIVSFDHRLENGDIVEVVTSPNAKGPARGWIGLAKSATARTKIRQWFKREKREENILRGRAALEAELKHQGLSVDLLTDPDVQPAALKKLAVTTMDDLYAAVGYGGMTAVRSINRFKEELNRLQKQDKALLQAEKLTQQAAPQPAAAEVKGIRVSDLDNCLVKFSRCCTPVPGDDVVGFITRGLGVSVHRKECTNYQTAQHKSDNRWVRVDWGDTEGSLYPASLTVNAEGRQNLIIDIATAMNTEKTTITSLNIREVQGGGAVAYMTLMVHNRKELDSAIRRLRGIRGVRDVKRPGV
jgi:GTP pyrophosphokinase